MHTYPSTATFKVSQGVTKDTFKLQESGPHHKRCHLSMCGPSTCGGATYGINCIPEGDYRAHQHLTIRDWEFGKAVKSSNGGGVSFNRYQDIQLGSEYVIRNVVHDAFLGVCGHSCGGHGTAGYGWSSPRWAYPRTMIFKVHGPPPPVGFWKQVCHTRNGNCKFLMTTGVCTSSSISVSSSQTNTLSSTLGASVGFDSLGVGVSSEVTVETSSTLQHAYTSSKQTCSTATFEAKCDRVSTITAQYQWHMAVTMPNNEVVYVQSPQTICTSGTSELRPRCPLGKCGDQYCQRCS